MKPAVCETNKPKSSDSMFAAFNDLRTYGVVELCYFLRDVFMTPAKFYFLALPQLVIHWHAGVLCSVAWETLSDVQLAHTAEYQHLRQERKSNLAAITWLLMPSLSMEFYCSTLIIQMSQYFWWFFGLGVSTCAICHRLLRSMCNVRLSLFCTKCYRYLRDARPVNTVVIADATRLLDAMLSSLMDRFQWCRHPPAVLMGMQCRSCVVSTFTWCVATNYFSSQFGAISPGQLCCISH